MLTHQFLNEDHSVQQTTFTGDIRIVVNFADVPYALKRPDYIVNPRGFVVFEKGKVWKSGETH